MRKLLAIVLAITLVFSLVGCGETHYEPIPSTEEESQTVMLLKVDGRSYEIKYELYRALFLNFKSVVDGGNADVWSGDGAEEYVEKIDNMILHFAADVYSVFALAYRLNLNPYSSRVDEVVENYIRVSIEGGAIDGEAYTGYDSYEDYLEKLKTLHLNYSVQALLFRYAIVMDMIEDYYLGSLTEDNIESGDTPGGALEFTRDDVKAFYDSDACVRVLRTYVSSSMSTDPTRPESVRAAICAAASGGEDAVRDAMIGMGALIPEPEMENGYIIAKHNLDKAYYGAMVDAALELEMGEVSPVITLHDGKEYTHYIMYRCEKSDEHFNSNYGSVAYIYLRNVAGAALDEVTDELIGSAEYTDILKGLDRSSITMD